MFNVNKMVYCYKYFLKFAWDNNRKFLWLMMIRFVVRSVCPFISIIGTKYLIDELVCTNRKILNIILWVMFLCVGNFFYQNILKIVDENVARINENFGRLLETKLSMCCIDIKYENTENPKTLDMIQNAGRALNETGQIKGLVEPLFEIASNVIILAGVVTLICFSIPWLLIPVVVSLLFKVVIGKIINEIRNKYFAKISRVKRGVDYYSTELQDTRYAKDIRIYKAAEIFNRNFNRLNEENFTYSKYFLLKLARMYSIEDIVVNICGITIYFIIGIYVLKEYISLGQFSSLYKAVQQFNDSLHSIIGCYIEIMYIVPVLVYYVDFVNQEKKLNDNNREETKGNVVKKNNQKLEIEFKNVSFKYPGTEKYILENICIKIKAGEHISIVGENGAGKTTFIKLLCRLYEHYEGEITVNGKEIREYSFKEYMSLLAVVFQDFKLFAFTLKENITMFNENKKKLNQICSILEISKWIEQLKDGENTYIYKYFIKNGIEPSGGESQTLAIARALYKDTPIVILDEPTAALDPIAEDKVYSKFKKLARGKTTIYISHRLSSCKFCDRIIVLKNGTIIEEGEHNELMKNINGLYHKMYNAQAKYYR